MLPFAIRHPPARAALRRGAGRLAMAVVLGGAVGPVLLVLGLVRTPVASAALVLNLELPFTVLLAAFWFREHLGRRVVAGAVLVTAAGSAGGNPARPCGNLRQPAAPLRRPCGNLLLGATSVGAASPPRREEERHVRVHRSAVDHADPRRDR